MREHRPLPIAARVLAPGLLLIALLAAGCSTQRTASDPDSLESGSGAGALLGAKAGASATLDELRGNGLFHMPLEVGNRWDYNIRMRTRLVSEGQPDVITEYESPWSSELTGMRLVNSHEYFLQTEYDPRVAAPPPAAQWALRQNRSGLYSLDLIPLPGAAAAAPAVGEGLASRFESAVARTVMNSPHRAAYTATAARLGARLAIMGMPGRGRGLPGLPGFPGNRGVGGSGGDGGIHRGGALPGEITLLGYPLFTGSRWIVRDSPRFSRVVLGRERTSVPAGDFTAWLLRGHSELYGPNDVVHFWYAREGLIKLAYHVESEVSDIEGNYLGRLSADVDQSLSALTLN